MWTEGGGGIQKEVEEMDVTWGITAGGGGGIREEAEGVDITGE